MKRKILIIFICLSLLFINFIGIVCATDETVLEGPIAVEVKCEIVPLVERKGIVKNKPLSIQQRIKKSCNKYNVPFNIALAIAKLETGHFKSNAYKYKNNPGGLSRNERPLYFSSIDKGVNAFVKNLSKNYISKGLNTPRKIGRKYCPVDSSWASKVERLMEKN